MSMVYLRVSSKVRVSSFVAVFATKHESYRNFEFALKQTQNFALWCHCVYEAVSFLALVASGLTAPLKE
jgi:hypothetical protein